MNDGACLNGDKGKLYAGMGVIVQCGDEVLYVSTKSVKLKGVTSNVAEYMALIELLSYLEMAYMDGRYEQYDSVVIYGDSQLIVNQVNSKWDCANERLDSLRHICYRFLDYIKIFKAEVVLKWLPRAENRQADILSKLSMDLIKSL